MLNAQTVTTFNATGSTQTWTCPAGIEYIQVEAWGAGGGGGNSNNTTTNGGSGGGGGAYSRSLLSVTPGTTYTLFVGRGGNGAPATSTTAAEPGGDSWFANSTNSLLAKGGTEGLNNNLATAGTGGVAANGVGQVKYNGSNGNVAATNAGGAGGSSAGTHADGVTTTAVGVLAYAPNGGGYGGEGETANTASNGGAPGGGGGGSNDATAAIGGNGADGKVVITEAHSAAALQEYYVPGTFVWTAPACITTVSVTAFGAGGGGGSSNNGTGSGGSGGGGGAYSSNVLTVVPGNTYTLVVGAGGSAGTALSTNAATAGGDSWFASAINSLLAEGGAAGGNNGGAFGAGGAAGNGVGLVRHSGGAGGTGDGNSGRGGGSSAGTGGNGNNGGDPAGGAAPAGGYAGGTASTTASVNGANGSTYGGGGGGSDDDEQSFGGNGGSGYVSIAYAPTVTLASNALTGQSITATSNGKNIPIHRVELTVGGCGSTLSGFGFTSSGNYLLSDINNFDLYLTTTLTFNDNDSLSSVAVPGVAGSYVYQPFNKVLAPGTYYVWVTVDLTRTAVNGRTIQVGATAANDVTVTGNSITGSATGSGQFTFGRDRTYNSNDTWTVPDCVTEIEIEVWGAGGGGGSSEKTTWSGCGAGGGGAYSKSILSVTPGATYNIVVGAGGAPGLVSLPAANGTGQTGGDSWFETSTGSVLILAKGGTGGFRDVVAPNTYTPGGFGGVGGAAAAGIGQTRLSGGDGGRGWHGSYGQAGSGGSSAGVAANGVDGNFASYTSPAGATIAPAGGGDGGIGGSGQGAGNPGGAGSTPGGGGGGGGAEGTGGADERVGGVGGTGQVRISWERTRTYNGSGTWTVPAGITSIDIEIWGAGGGGAGANNTLVDGQPGGGGGAYTKSSFLVTPGQTYSVNVGNGGLGGSVNGSDGGDSWVSLKADGSIPTNTSEGALAKGGTGAIYSNTGGTIGTGGLASGGIGDVKFDGGDGGAGANAGAAEGGGGGSSGGNASNGNDGSSSAAGGAGGVAPAGGFAGGKGGWDDNTNGATANSLLTYHGAPGDIAGGGGGASSGDDNGARPSTYALGGDGSNGRVLIDYTSEDPQIGDKSMPAAFICPLETDQPIHAFILTEIPLCDPTLLTVVTAIDFTTTGTYLPSDITNFKLYYSTTDNLAGATLLATNSSPAAAGLQTDFSFAGSPVTLISDTEVYFWITMDVSATASGGRILGVSQTTTANITASESFSFEADASGTQTFQDLSLGSTKTPPTQCSGPFNYTPASANGAATFAWSRAIHAGITEAATSTSGTGSISETLTNTTSSPIDVTYTYVLTANGCSGSGENVVVTINPDAELTLLSAVGTDDQSLCLNDTLVNILYSYNAGASGATISGLPAGLTATGSTPTVGIIGAVTQEGVFTYTVQSTGACVQTSTTGTLTVGLSIITPGTDTQSVCKNDAITPITYAVGSIGATVTGLPAGVNQNFAGGVLTISGNPSIEGTYNYTVSTTGTCSSPTGTPTFMYGVLTVGIGKAAVSGDTLQSVCKDAAINTIVYNTVGGYGTSIDWYPNMPTGIDTASTANTYSISGTPSVAGTFDYTVTAEGTCGTKSSKQGTLTVGIGKAAISGDTIQSVCRGEAINTIVYNTVGGYGTSINWYPNMPTGVDTASTASTYSISGTPSVAGTYNYTVTASGSCTSSSEKYGIITVGIGRSAVSGDSVQSVCRGDAISTIVYNTVGGFGSSITWDPRMPSGVDTASTINTFSITGTPTVAGTFNYTVMADGTCTNPSYKSGTLTVGIGRSAISGDSVQSVCKYGTIVPIVYNTVGDSASTIQWDPYWPTGIDTLGDGDSTFTIRGTPRVAGTFNYTVTAKGTCTNPSEKYGTLTVGIGRSAISGDSIQSVCKNDPITTIVYNTVGSSAATISWSPSVPPGIINTPTDSTFTIAGTPSVEGTYEYTLRAQGTCDSTSFKYGKLTVGFGSPVSGTGDRNTCIGVAIQQIVYPLPDFVTGVTPTGLPAGVTGDTVGTNYIISGTPTVPGTFNYTVTAVSTACIVDSYFTGVITVGSDTINAISSNIKQDICLGQSIDPIKYILSGTATGASIIPSPANGGLSGSYDLITKEFEITGVPTSAPGVPVTYTVITSGGCAQGVAVANFTVLVVNPQAEFSADLEEGVAPLYITYTNTSNTDATQFNWIFGDGNVSADKNTGNMFVTPGSYTTTLIASYDGGICPDSATVVIDVEEFTVPTVFTPNSDSKNDLYKIKTIGLAEIDVKIFNRWGTQVASWDQLDGYWDGTSESTDVDCPEGTYFVVVKIIDGLGKEILHKKTITLIR